MEIARTLCHGFRSIRQLDIWANRFFRAQKNNNIKLESWIDFRSSAMALKTEEKKHGSFLPCACLSFFLFVYEPFAIRWFPSLIYSNGDEISFPSDAYARTHTFTRILSSEQYVPFEGIEQKQNEEKTKKKIKINIHRTDVAVPYACNDMRAWRR